MTSRSQIASNRRNARRSTGPTTAAGKQAVSGNARRHGLSGRLVAGSDACRQAEELARSVLGTAVHGREAEAAARDYAEAQVKLALIRDCRTAWLEELLQPSSGGPGQLADHHGGSGHPSIDLARLARYERMKRAQRLRALEQLEQAGICIDPIL